MWTNDFARRANQFFLSSPFCKNISLRLSGKSPVEARPIPSREEGRWPSSRTLGRDAVDAAGVGVKRNCRAGFPVSDHRHADDGAKARLSLLAKTGGCVRQNRVVLAPVAGVKSAEVFQTQPGSAKSSIRR